MRKLSHYTFASLLVLSLVACACSQPIERHAVSIEEVRARLKEFPEPDRKVSPWKNWGETSFDELSEFILLWFSHDMKGRAELLEARLEEGPDGLGTLLLLWNYQLLDCEFDEALSTLDQILRQFEKGQKGAVQDVRPYFLDVEVRIFVQEYEEETQRLLANRSRNQRAWPPEKLSMSSSAGPFFGGSLLHALIEDGEIRLLPEERERLIALGIIGAPPPPPVPLSNRFIASLAAAPLDASAEDLAMLIHHGDHETVRKIGRARLDLDVNDLPGNYLLVSAALLEWDIPELKELASRLHSQMKNLRNFENEPEWQSLLEEVGRYVMIDSLVKPSQERRLTYLRDLTRTTQILRQLFKAQEERAPLMQE